MSRGMLVQSKTKSLGESEIEQYAKKTKKQSSGGLQLGNQK